MRNLHVALVALLVLGGSLYGGPGAGKYHEDERWGYKVRVPSGWLTAALSADEEWIASKHLAERERQAKKSVFWTESRPEMWVIGFPHARLEERGTRKGEEKNQEKLFFNNPYRDYKDFLKRERWYAEGGYYFSEEKEDEVAGMKVTMYEIIVDKMVDAPFRMVTWVYHFEDIDFAVQFKVLEDYYRTYSQTFKTCLKSFRRVERKEALPGAATTGTKRIFEDVDESELTPEERAKKRLDEVEQQYRREIAVLPKGWYDYKTDHFLVLSNGSKKYTKEVVQHAEAIRGYLDETFGNLGVDYVPPAIIRVFATWPEYEAYSRGTKRFWSSSSQVLVVEGTAPDNVTWDVTQQWLEFKNKELYWNMPEWIRTGLQEHMSFAKARGKSVKFVFDQWDQEQLKALLKNNEAVPLKDLISGASEKTTEGGEIKIDIENFEKMMRQGTQAGSVVTYLLTKGNRGKTKGALANYLKGLVGALQEAEAEFEATMKKIGEQLAEEARARNESEAAKPDDEEDSEEDEEKRSQEEIKRQQEMRDAFSKKRATLRQAAFDAGFGHLSDKDWQSLDKAWRRFVK